jgi:hypothetical protein
VCPHQRLMLAGLEHGRTIPLAATRQETGYKGRLRNPLPPLTYPAGALEPET